MLVHESPEKLTLQEDPGWGWGLGGVLAAIAVVSLAASSGFFQGIKWVYPLTRTFVATAALGMLAASVVLLLRPKHWILEMDRKQRKMVLLKKNLWPRAVNTWSFGEVVGTRIVESEQRANCCSLEILVASQEGTRVVHRFFSDKPSCQRAGRAIERILEEPPWEPPVVTLRARIRM